MIAPNPSDFPFGVWSDQTVNTYGTSPGSVALFDVPEDFIGRVEVDVFGKILDTGTSEEGGYQSKLVLGVARRPGEQATTITGGSVSLTGYEMISPLAAGFTASLLLDVNSVLLQVTGLDGKNSAFQARAFRIGANAFLLE